MPLLDEEVKIPKGSDQGWLSKCKSHNADHPCLKPAGSNPNRFVVVHYAGDVPYEIGGFVATNKDDLFRDLYDLASGAASDITRSLFPPKVCFALFGGSSPNRNPIWYLNTSSYIFQNKTFASVTVVCMFGLVVGRRNWQEVEAFGGR